MSACLARSRHWPISRRIRVLNSAGVPLTGSTPSLSKRACTSGRSTARLTAAARRAVERADIQARFDKDGVEPVGGTPAAFKALVTREIAQWRDLAKQADIKVE